MENILLWLVFIVTVISAFLVTISLFRSSKSSEDADKIIREELRYGREESSKSARELREEVTSGLKSANDTLTTTLTNMSQLQHTQLDGLTKQLKELTDSNQNSLDVIRSTIDKRVKELQNGNEKKLEQMRKTVDEKLHETLEKRLGESFKIVSERLEAVQRGLGEMQTLATGVGDLKRVLTNVKARGTWAEVQLGAILEQILTPAQFEKNVKPKIDSDAIVEFAIKLPGPVDEPGNQIWLPIDSKFPQEDYLRIQEAADKGEPEAVQKATEALARSIKSSAREIHDKYINPPHTTDFAIMFLATEGLFAEVLRHTSLIDMVQREYRIVIAGPTTLAAILSSLRMGFQTLAIEQRASEVWQVLSAVKTEFSRFGDVLDKVKRQLSTASRTIEQTGVRTRAMEKKLRAVEQLPESEASQILDLPPATDEVDIETIIAKAKIEE
ncbi:MAG: DNA recombination protein RmuC [candidate division Zixibacteria bacterium]|nr:DNA recombination protein RmuC [candidate division Zixibacteria bacterium]